MMRLTLALASATEGYWLTKNIVSGDLGQFRVEEHGEEHRLFVGAKQHSFWHDIPLHAADENIFHFVCEVPKGDSAKREVSHTTAFNPIVHEHVDGEAQHFNHMTHDGETGLFLNEGSFPQTWESPDHRELAHRDNDLYYIGDSKPLDALQVNEKPCKVGEIQRVRILGAFGLVHDDDQEASVGGNEHLDWKIIVQDIDDPDRLFPEGGLKEIIPGHMRMNLLEWYKHHKKADGGYEAKILGKGTWYAQKMATDLVDEFHSHWAGLFVSAHADL